MRCLAFGIVAIGAALAACESQQQQVSGMQPQAVETAQKRGAFDLNCPAATAQVLSNEMVQTRVTTGPLGWGSMPPQRAEYTVGVEGCGKRATYYVICAEGGTGCVATGTENTIQSNSDSAKQ
jgi:hypothetical protein